MTDEIKKRFEFQLALEEVERVIGMMVSDHADMLPLKYYKQIGQLHIDTVKMAITNRRRINEYVVSR